MPCPARHSLQACSKGHKCTPQKSSNNDAGRQALQNAYITRNIDKAAASFRERTDVDTVYVFEVEVDIWTPKGSGKARNKLAFI